MIVCEEVGLDVLELRGNCCQELFGIVHAIFENHEHGGVDVRLVVFLAFFEALDKQLHQKGNSISTFHIVIDNWHIVAFLILIFLDFLKKLPNCLATGGEIMYFLMVFLQKIVDMIL
jgi:hypothetical protein